MTIIRSLTSNPAKLFDINAGNLENFPADIAILDLISPGL